MKSNTNKLARRNVRSVFRGPHSVLFLFAALAVCGAFAPPCCAQTVEGTWIAPWRVLDSGEDDRLFLNLHQSASTITGTASTIGHRYQVTGTMTGNHLVLDLTKGGSERKVVAELVDAHLHLTYESAQMVASPARPADDYPAIDYISPPVLEDLPANGLAQTPPMGWNSWNAFESRIDDKTVRAMADEMVKNGMRDAGFVYVNIDDTWEGVRDAQGNLTANKKFPDMKRLADYIHSKGLKLGIYSSPGTRTCGEYPGSYGHEAQDAKTFAAWGVDLLKYDWCGARMIYQKEDLRAVYQTMGDALRESGRPIVYSLCEYGDGDVSTWGAKAGGNLWRTTSDIRDSWSSMIGNIKKQVPTAAAAGPGHWNDPDMLEIGNGHMTDDEYRTHMSLWALTAAPLLAGNDIRTMTPATRDILLNQEVIAVDQDGLGKQASPVSNGTLDTWVKPLADGSIAVGVVNMGTVETAATVKLADLGLGTNVKSARNLWKHADVAFVDGAYTARVASHGVLMLRINGAK